MYSDNFRLSATLLQWGADVDLLDRDGQTPLMYAVRSKSPYAVRAISLFLEHGSDIRIKDRYGKTALDYAVSNNTESGMSGQLMLLKYGAKLGSEAIYSHEPMVEFYNKNLILLIFCIPLDAHRFRRSVWLNRDMLRMLRKCII